MTVTILAHSIGGIVARTALLLDNHPSSNTGNCLIDSILMLGTPQKYVKCTNKMASLIIISIDHRIRQTAQWPLLRLLLIRPGVPPIT